MFRAALSTAWTPIIGSTEFEGALVLPAASVDVAVNTWLPRDSLRVVKPQFPLALAVVLPKSSPLSYTVTVLLSSAVPVSVAVLFLFFSSEVITGGGGAAFTGAFTVTSNALDAGAGPCRSRIGRGEGVGAGRQVRRGEAPGAGAARGRGAEGRSAAIRHRHRGTVRCGSRQGHRLIGIFHAGANDRRGGGPEVAASPSHRTRWTLALVPAEVVSVAVKA